VSYQVLARKYRPQTFADLIGQEHIARTLAFALDHGRLHHAYLFSGVRGTGKTTSARILAKGLNCVKGVTSHPCLECASCREIAVGGSIDVIEIDAASNTGVDNVRDVIINNIAISPARDRYKVFIIDEVHMLSVSAFNALLKTLEEPPSHVVFIMATTELHKVPDTILSRCQQFEFRQIPTGKILGRLREIGKAEKIKVGDAALSEIARAGAGSLRDALSAFDQVIAFSGAEIHEEDVTTALGLVSVALLGRASNALATQDGAQILALVDDLASGGYDLRNFTRELMAYLRHLLVVKSGIKDGELLGVADAEVPKLIELAGHFSEEDLVRAFHLLAGVEKEIKDSPFPRFALEVGLFKLTHALRLRPLDELIARIDALAAQIDQGGGSSGPSAASSSPSSARASNTSGTSGASGPGQKGPSNRAAEPPAPRSVKPVMRPAEAAPPPIAAAPPDFDDFVPFDQMEPEEFAEPERAIPRRPEPRAATPTAAMRSTPTAPAAPLTASDNQGASPVAQGREIGAIIAELDKLNRGLLVTALEDAQNLSYADGVLTINFARENVFAGRLRDSGSLFRSLGERLLGVPLRLDVRVGSASNEPPVPAPKSKRDELRQRALENPAVKRFVERFRGEVIDVEELPR
jgi:DNA polymerase-3 subunit gamma/tau